MKRIIFALLLLNFLIVKAQTNLMNTKTWAYQLQNINISNISADTTFDLIVMDYSQDGLDENKFTPSQISTIKNSGKYAISYISIGEAENYRYYWDTNWVSSPPSWLGPENPDWEGNYKVRFWETEWQDIVFAYVDTIIQQGFDGIYLDIIDAYYYWQDENPEQPYADSLMCMFVKNLRSHIDTETGNNNFIIIPQNGEDVINQINVSSSLKADFFAAINAVGVEDVFYLGDFDEDNDYDPDTYRIGELQEYLTNQKQVFSIEYLTNSVKIQQYTSVADSQSYIPYVCIRALDQLCEGILVTDISELNILNNTFTKYPNPTNGTFTIEIPSQQNYLIEIISITGKVIYKEQAQGGIKQIDLSQYLKGIYLLKLTNNKETIVEKVIVK